MLFPLRLPFLEPQKLAMPFLLPNKVPQLRLPGRTAPWVAPKTSPPKDVCSDTRRSLLYFLIGKMRENVPRVYKGKQG
jgi:hypothetical protein